VTVLPMDENGKIKLHWCGKHCRDCVDTLTVPIELRVWLGVAYEPDGLVMATLTDAELERIMSEWAKRYEERLFAGPSATAEKPKEEKRWGWGWSWNGGDDPKGWVSDPDDMGRDEAPKRKLTFREWLDGGMKGECRWRNGS
jgi:hypothetical protein